MSLPPLAVHPARARPLLGIALKVAGTLLLGLMGGIVKHLSVQYSVVEIVFFRSLSGMVPVVALILMSSERFGLLRTRHPWAHVRRAGFGLAGLATSFWTISLLPYADATALSFSAPIFVVLFAIPLLGERVGAFRLSAVGVGFIGVLMIAQPHIAGGAGVSAAPLGVAVGVLSSVLIALAQIALRFVGRTERALTTVFYYSSCCTVMSLCALPFGWRTPDWGGFGLLMLIGLIGGIAQLCFTQGYRYADASALAPFDYATLVWALLIGIFAFSEFPHPVVLGGAAIVALSGLVIVFRERYLARKRRRAMPEPISI